MGSRASRPATSTTTPAIGGANPGLVGDTFQKPAGYERPGLGVDQGRLGSLLGAIGNQYQQPASQNISTPVSPHSIGPTDPGLLQTLFGGLPDMTSMQSAPQQMAPRPQPTSSQLSTHELGRLMGRQRRW
jgi:hypothetical protein